MVVLLFGEGSVAMEEQLTTLGALPLEIVSTGLNFYLKNNQRLIGFNFTRDNC